jgi:hypothetical protein
MELTSRYGIKMLLIQQRVNVTQKGVFGENIFMVIMENAMNTMF